MPLVHAPMAAAASSLQPVHHADAKAGAKCFSWSPMGCRAQALGPSSTALPGHSRELAWKRGNQDRISAPTGTRTRCAGAARRRISLLSHGAGHILLNLFLSYLRFLCDNHVTSEYTETCFFFNNFPLYNLRVQVYLENALRTETKLKFLDPKNM